MQRRLLNPRLRFPLSSRPNTPFQAFSNRSSKASMASEAVTSVPVVNRTAHPFERSALEGLLTKRFFFAPSFEIYNGVAGFYDLGPPGSSLQANLLSEWRKHFIIEEEMLEIESTCITLDSVLKTSGHVDKFTDFMVKDKKNGDIFRADHLVEAVLEARLKGDKEARGQVQEPAEKAAEDASATKSKKKKVKSQAVKLEDAVVSEYEKVLAQIDNYSGDDLGQIIRNYDIKAPETGNELTEPVEFNLMFEAQIGPTGHLKGYLRPETAQGHFTNFGRLLEFNNGRVPFASAQIGKSFRNEISPRQGLLRVREFVMAEIEHYVDPLDKSHYRFDEVKDTKLMLLAKDVQTDGRTDLVEMTIGEAVDKGVVDNQTLGYFMARIHLFLIKIGIDPQRLRFRQHMANEMAHYAADCWDAEIQSSYGWIECVGCADRSAYDLTVHSVKTGRPLVVRQELPEPKIEDRLAISIDKKKFGPKFKGDAKALETTLLALDQERLHCVKTELEQKASSSIRLPDGKELEVTGDLIKIEMRTFKETVREFTPNVIEPSFGIGRILYSLLEHAYWARADDATRAVLSLPPLVAPVKVLVAPISANDTLRPIVREISLKLRKAGVASRVDDSGASLGRRYSRNDELGTPFGITVDFASAKNGTVTLRERDTLSQRIGSIDDVVASIQALANGTMSWPETCAKLPEYSGVQDA